MDGGEVARGVLGLGLLDDREDALGPLVDPRSRDDPVGRGLLPWDADAPNDAPPAQAFPRADQLPDTGRIAEDDVVAPEHGEGLVPDQVARLQDGVAVPLRLVLHDDPDVRQLFGAREQVDVLLAEFDGKTMLEPLVRSEIRIERFLPRSDHDDDAVDSGARQLRNDELDDRRVDERQQLLRDGAADRQEACPEAAGGDDPIVDRP